MRAEQIHNTLQIKELIKISDMKSSDARQIYKLASAAKLSFWSVEDYQREPNRSGGFAKTAKIEDKIIGFIVARLITLTPGADINSDSDKIIIDAEVYSIAVEDGFKRLGIGSRLLQSLFSDISSRIQEGQDSSVRAVIRLEVRESNVEAIKFYTANCFETAYKRRNFYTFPTEDALVLQARFEV